MKKLFLSVFVITTFAIYVLRQKTGETVTLPAVVPNSPPPETSTTTAPTSAGRYRNGQYTGDVADAYYGNLQVKAVITGGRINDVRFLDYPHDRQNSVEINTQAIPFLKSEAIQAQSAQVDIVSGATQTSQAFIQSLQSALSQAQ